MNDCPQLESFLDGNLRPSEEASFETHLENCHACRMEVELHKQLDEHIRSGWMTIESPVGLVEKLDQARTETQERASSIPHGIKWLVLAASVFGLLAVASWYIGTRGNQNLKTAIRKPHPIGLGTEEISVANPVTPVAFVQDKARPDTLILVTESPSDKPFTIVKAYPAIQLTKSTSTNFGKEQDEQTN